MNSLIGVKKAACILSVWVAGLVLVSCENNPNLPVPVEDVTGKYSGTISFDKFVSYEGDTETVLKEEIELEFNDGRVTVPDFPVSSILSVLEDEEEAKKIESKLGNVSYQMGYTSQVSSDDSWMKLFLSPGPLTFSYTSADGTEKVIKAFMYTGVKTSYYESRQMQLKIIIEEIQINGRPLFIMDEQYITFDVRKTNGN